MLPHCCRDLQNYILQRYYTEKLNRLNAAEPLHKAGMNKLYGEVARRAHNDQLFQAFEFRRFNRLDDYEYHLRQGLKFLSDEDALHYTHEVITLALVRQKLDQIKGCKLIVP